MKLPKLELRIRPWKAPEQNKHILKQYQMGKSKYILQYALLYSAMYIGVKILLDLMTGKIFTVVPGFPAQIVFHARSIIDIAIWTILSPLGGYLFANGQWKRIESSYHKLFAEEQTPLDEIPAIIEEPDPVALRKVPLLIRNLR